VFEFRFGRFGSCRRTRTRVVDAGTGISDARTDLLRRRRHRRHRRRRGRYRRIRARMETDDASLEARVARERDDRVFHTSTSHDARMALLERRLQGAPTSASKDAMCGGVGSAGASGGGGRKTTGGSGGAFERCSLDASSSDSDSDDGDGSTDERSRGGGRYSEFGVVAVDTTGSGKRRRRSFAADGAENEMSLSQRSLGGAASGGLARSTRHPAKKAGVSTAEPHVSLLERFENTGSGFKSASPLMEATPSQGYVRQFEEERVEFEKKVAALEEKLRSAQSERDEYERGCEALRQENNLIKEAHEKMNAERKSGVQKLAVNMAMLERKQMRMQIAEEGLRLGTIGVQRIGSALQEVWEDGRAFHELDQRLENLAESKKLADEKRKQVKKNLPPPGSVAADTAAHAEYVLSEEVHKARMAIIRKEEEAIKAERESLEREKAAHIRALKRTRDEDGSRFNKHPVLGDRYVLMNLLGRGGFSEVYKAWDSVQMREVACKLHQLNPQWSEERKRTYVRHAARECSIHKSLDHPHVVRLIDVFEVDSDSFCTVLELCTGDDLDARLKSQGSISEREARAILAQVFSGLAYMSSGQKRIIHYDLKPGNILFDEAGRVKITDFGLSKIMEERAGVGTGIDSGMELTSQGAGTYWYLPPECFETGPAPPKISSKVDTWSCGVILFQMIYGKRPFGHDMSQEQILQSGTIRKATTVEFPNKPTISAEGKAFITKCLSYKQSERPDVLEASQDPYMTFLSK